MEAGGRGRWRRWLDAGGRRRLVFIWMEAGRLTWRRWLEAGGRGRWRRWLDAGGRRRLVFIWMEAGRLIVANDDVVVIR